MEDKYDFIEQMKSRTKQFVLDSIKLYQKLPKTDEARLLGKQYLRAASSVGANYRACCRGRSKAEFFAKLSIVVEEADESVFWLEILTESNIIKENISNQLMKEGNEILKIVSRARKTASSN